MVIIKAKKTPPHWLGRIVWCLTIYSTCVIEKEKRKRGQRLNLSSVLTNKRPFFFNVTHPHQTLWCDGWMARNQTDVSFGFWPPHNLVKQQIRETFNMKNGSTFHQCYLTTLGTQHKTIYQHYKYANTFNVTILRGFTTLVLTWLLISNMRTLYPYCRTTVDFKWAWYAL